MKPKQRNPYVVSARFRKAGAHTSTDKRRGGRRGDFLAEALEEYADEQRREEESSNNSE